MPPVAPRTRRFARSAAAASVALLLGVGSLAIAAPADAANRPGAGKAYPAKAENGFLTACADSARKSAPKLSVNAVNAYCICLLGAFESRYTIDEFEAMDKAASKGKKLTATQRAYVDQVSRACASKIR